MTPLCSSLAANTRELALSIASRDHSEKMSQKIRRLAKELSRFRFPRTLRRSLAQTARLDAVDNSHGFTWAATGALVAAQIVLRTCKAKEGRICHPEPWFNGHTTYSRSLASRLYYFSCPGEAGLFYSRKHGWTYRVMLGTVYTTPQPPLDFHHPADEALQALALHTVRASCLQATTQRWCGCKCWQLTLKRPS